MVGVNNLNFENMEDLKIFDEKGKQLHLGAVIESFLKHYDSDALMIEINRQNNVIEVFKCVETDDYYSPYNYERMEDINLY